MCARKLILSCALRVHIEPCVDECLTSDLGKPSPSPRPNPNTNRAEQRGGDENDVMNDVEI